MAFLSSTDVTASASGKTILVGEHAVVYGYKAIAFSLSHVTLNVTLKAHTDEILKSWDNVWSIFIKGKAIDVSVQMQNLLYRAFESALTYVGFEKLLVNVEPQKLVIQSQIPLGGGMGGSAAISTCLLRIAQQIVQKKLSYEQEINFANRIDSLFHHGKASGLDVCAVVSGGMVQFQKEKPIEILRTKLKFWIALVDSGQRCETAKMVEKVKMLVEKDFPLATKIFQSINLLAQNIRSALEKGNMENFVECLNLNQHYLCDLGVSTKKINELIDELKTHGALAAKLTGGGGGGLVLAIFQNKPDFLIDLYGYENVYLSEII